MMPAVRRGDSPYTDSVWIKDANLIEAVKRGAEELWVLWCIGNTPAYRDGSFLQYVHMIEQSANGVLFEELDRISELNDAIAAGHSPYGQKRRGDRPRGQAAPSDPARPRLLLGPHRRRHARGDGLRRRPPLPGDDGRRSSACR